MLVETIITLPVVLIFLIGLLEFSSVLLAKLQVETGLKGAARYLARCDPDPAASCNETWARNIAVYGHPSGASNQRVHSWLKPGESLEDVIQIEMRSPTPAAGGESFQVVRVSTNFDFLGSPLIGMIGYGSGIPIVARHDERVIEF